MKPNPVNWFEIYVQDIQRAKAFYEKVLAVDLSPLDSPTPEIEMFTFPMEMGAPGAAGAIAKVEGVPSGGNSTMVYFSCEDCATEASRVEAAGGKICKEKFSIGPYGFIAIATDTEGNAFGLHSGPAE